MGAGKTALEVGLMLTCLTLGSGGSAHAWAAEQGQANRSPPRASTPHGDASRSQRKPASSKRRNRRSSRYRTVVGSKKNRDGLDAQRAIDAHTPGFATAIEVDAIGGATSSDGVAQVLDRSVGLTTRQAGGLGQFSSLSIRGSSPQQVEIRSDGIPLGDSLAGAVNLADLSLTPLSRIEIYRGHLPITMGASAIGGVINLVSRAGTPGTTGRLRVRGETGSFGTRGGHTSLWQPMGRHTVFSSDLSYAGSSGEFLFFNDHATPQFTGDDSFDYRQNNAYNRGLGRLRVDYRRGPWRLMSQGFGLYKHQGIAGVAGAPSPGSSLTTGLGKLMLAATRRRFGARPGGQLRWLASVGQTGRTFVETSITGAPRQHTRVVDTFVSPQLRLPLWRGAFTTLTADQRSEWIRVQTKSGDPATVLGTLDRARHRFGVGLELEQFVLDNRLRVVPAIRVEALRSRFPTGNTADQLAAADRVRSDVAASPRVGVRLRLAPGLDLRSSVGRYFRPPTVLELFGDRGAIRGNEDLLPEQGTAIDGGLTLDRAIGTRHHVYSQLAGFHRHSQDTIAMLPTGTAVRAFNLAGTRVEGLEAALSLALWSRHAQVEANYTLMPTRNLQAGATGGSRPLPGRPLHQLFVRLSTGHRFTSQGGLAIEPRLAYTLDFLDAMYLDPSGRVAIPPRAIHGASLVLRLDERVRWALEGRNLANRRVTTWDASIYDNAGSVPTAIVDYLRYPLPGLSVLMTLTFDLDVGCRPRKTCTHND